MDINVSLEQLSAFYDCISRFKEKINNDCKELEFALSRFERTIDDATVSQISYEIKEINNKIEESQPALTRLGNRVIYYRVLLDKVKNIAGGG